MYGPCRHQYYFRLVHVQTVCPQSISSTLWKGISQQPLGQTWKKVLVATNSTIRRNHSSSTVRPSRPLWGKSNGGTKTNAAVAAQPPEEFSLRYLESEALRRLGGVPKRSILSLSDLESVNPNPTTFPIMIPITGPTLEASSKPNLRKKRTKKKDKPVLEAESSVETIENIEMAEADEIIQMTTTITQPVESKVRLTPLRKQILELEKTYPDCVLLVRVGEFYELYDHNAVEYGHLLGLKVVSKAFGGQVVPFTGFPIRQLDRHLETLVGKHNLKVALCEQYQGDHQHGGSSRSFRRSVYRIVTPGTLIDEQFLDQGENNWLLAVATEKTSRFLGLSWLDLSTGDFFTQETTFDSFGNDLARIRPREIILNSNLRRDPEHPVLQTIQKMGKFVIDFEDMRSAAQMAAQVENEILKEAEEQLGFNPQYLRSFSNREQSACLSILRYVNHTQMGRRPVVQQPTKWQDDSIMKIDKNTIEALELVRTLRDASRTGSLLYHLDKTKTKAGSRLLASWLTSPLTNVDKINNRLDMVEFFGQDSHLIHDIEVYLTQCRDAQRAIQKLSLGQIDPQDLVAIRTTLEALQKIKLRLSDKIMLEQSIRKHPIEQSLSNASIPVLVQETVDNICGLEHICKLIRDVVDENMGQQSQEYGFINQGAGRDRLKSSRPLDIDMWSK
ncbi:DNA mismatch repair ATPase msh1 [Lobosporangium transversale]|nr:DNA mismatch repair ATPase msh1 [Lobosporangium transversale]